MSLSEGSCDASRDDEWEKLLARYLDVLPGQVEVMAEAFESGDVVKVETVAHKVKGTAGTYGFLRIAEAASQVELSVQSQEWDETCREIERLAELVQLRISEL